MNGEHSNAPAPVSTDEQLSVEAIIATMAERFTSGNPIQVERVHITRKEWHAFLEDLRHVGDMGFHGNRKNTIPCQSCVVADAIDSALEKLK